MEYFVLAGIMLVTGLIGGVLAGLLGVGGGIVIVPVLEVALGFAGVDPAVRMHVAVGTSLATIIPTSIASSRAHFRRQSVDLTLVRRWAVFIFGGAVAGTLIAGQVESWVLAAVFATIALLVAIKMLLPLDNYTVAEDVPPAPFGLALPVAIGGFSTMMGIGGGTLTVPILTLLSRPIHLAVGTGALFGLLISVPGTLGFVVTGWANPLCPPASLGYVNLLGLAVIAPATVLAAPYGAKVAHSLTGRRLSILFGCFLAIVSLRMFYQAVVNH